MSAPEREMRLQHLAVDSGTLVSARPECQLQGSGSAVLVEGNVWGWKLEDGFISQCQHATLNRRGRRACGTCFSEAAIPIPCVRSCACLGVCPCVYKLLCWRNMHQVKSSLAQEGSLFILVGSGDVAKGPKEAAVIQGAS